MGLRKLPKSDVCLHAMSLTGTVVSGFSSDSQKLTHPAVFSAETQETGGGEELYPVTDTAGTTRLGNDLKESHRLITDTARFKR